MKSPQQAKIVTDIMRRLNSAGLPTGPHIILALAPHFNRKQLAGRVQITVMPSGFDTAKLTRGAVELTPFIDVGIQRALPTDDDPDTQGDQEASAFACMELLEEVAVTLYKSNYVKNVETIASPAPEHLARDVWTTVYRVEIHGYKRDLT